MARGVLAPEVERLLSVPDLNLRAYSITLTARPEPLVQLVVKTAVRFMPAALLRAGAIAQLLALDKKGQWHLHGLVLLPASSDPQKLVRIWRHLWPRRHRPSPKAQEITPLDGRRDELIAVLAHHLRGPRRAGLSGPSIPAMPDRAWACGALQPA
ncbi:MAG TPA: hypothetical protein VKB92_07910 [Myxococcales bacterium]|nr:hypothetical protein [Myxococcales bacterium]